jgi:hypothetical protein
MGEEILQAFIFAERELLCEIHDTEPMNLILTLLSVYFSFNRGYPKVSNQFYEFLAFALFGNTSFVGNPTYNKFKMKYIKS